MTLPTLHMNGTGKKMLAEGYDDASDVLDAFKAAFSRIEFNARDYCPQGPQAWDAALEQRYAMNRIVAELHDYIEAHRAHIHS